MYIVCKKKLCILFVEWNINFNRYDFLMEMSSNLRPVDSKYMCDFEKKNRAAVKTLSSYW